VRETPGSGIHARRTWTSGCPARVIASHREQKRAGSVPTLLLVVWSENRLEAGGDARLRATADRLGLGDRVDLSGDALGEGLGLGQEGVVA
jgi:hypothetical protein